MVAAKLDGGPTRGEAHAAEDRPIAPLMLSPFGSCISPFDNADVLAAQTSGDLEGGRSLEVRRSHLFACLTDAHSPSMTTMWPFESCILPFDIADVLAAQTSGDLEGGRSFEVRRNLAVCSSWQACLADAHSPGHDVDDDEDVLIGQSGTGCWECGASSACSACMWPDLATWRAA